MVYAYNCARIMNSSINKLLITVCGRESCYDVLIHQLGRLSIDAVLGRTAGLKNGARKPHTIL